MIRPLAGALALVLLAAGAAQAASHNRDTFIREQDIDGDGKVSKEDFAKGREAAYARQDANDDGVLSKDEYAADFLKRLPALLETQPEDRRDEQRAREIRQTDVRFGVLDSDKNGRLTPAEFAYSGWRMFVYHDTNRDGAVGQDDVPEKTDD